MIRISTLLPLLLLAVPAAAQQHPPDPPLCPDAMTTLDMRRCLAGERARLDAHRDSLEARLRRGADSATLHDLDAASTAWETYRDADCRVDAGAYEGGTLEPVVVLACRVELTRERIGWLEARLRDPAWADRIERAERESSCADAPAAVDTVRMERVELPAPETWRTTEGSEVVVYLSGGKPRIVRVRHFGEMGCTATLYRLTASGGYLAEREEVRYARPISVESEPVESRRARTVRRCGKDAPSDVDVDLVETLDAELAEVLSLLAARG